MNETLASGDDLRSVAIARLKKRRDFWQHITAYFVVNLAINVVWLVTMPGGFYWPVFPLFFWGIGVVFHGIDTFSPAMPTEQQIQREMHRLAHR